MPSEPVSKAMDDGGERSVSRPATERLTETFTYLDDEVERLKHTLSDVESRMRTQNESLAQLERTEQAFEGKMRDANSKIEQEFVEKLAGLLDQTKELMEVLEANSKKSSEIVETISGEANRSAFHAEAEAQREQADRWRWASIVLSTCAVILLVTLSWGSPASLRVVDSLQHVALSVIILGVSGYAASQSAQHRRREELARRLELDIETLNPLTDGLPEENRLKIRSLVVERIFTRQETSPATPTDISPTPADINLLSRVFAALSPNPTQSPSK